jgi:hypothetical protein
VLIPVAWGLMVLGNRCLAAGLEGLQRSRLLGDAASVLGLALLVLMGPVIGGLTGDRGGAPGQAQRQEPQQRERPRQPHGRAEQLAQGQSGARDGFWGGMAWVGGGGAEPRAVAVPVVLVGAAATIGWWVASLVPPGSRCCGAWPPRSVAP